MEWVEQRSKIVTSQREFKLVGEFFTIGMYARPSYCDRGRWIAYIEKSPPINVDQIDGHDGWPRYYFDLDRAKAELEAWLTQRENNITQKHK